MTFMGHYHRWLLVTPEGIQTWRGDHPIVLDAAQRYLVTVHAVCDGRCACLTPPRTSYSRSVLTLKSQ